MVAVIRPANLAAQKARFPSPGFLEVLGSMPYASVFLGLGLLPYFFLLPAVLVVLPVLALVACSGHFLG